MSNDISPHGFLTDTNLFVLEQAATTDLFENILTGVLLPTTEEGYRTRLSIPSEVEDLPQAIRLLLSVYSPVNADCVSFRDETMVKMINMAEDIYSYAQKVAGDGASYFLICQSLRDMADHDTSYSAMHLSTFTLEIDASIRDIVRYRSKAQVIAREVHRFYRQLASDAENLKDTHGNINNELDREVASNMDAVQAEIAELRTQAKGLQAQAQAQPEGGWMRVLMCMMRGASSSTIEDRQKNIAVQIGELEAAIQSSTENQINDSLHPYAARMTADMALVEEGLNNLVAACSLVATIVDGIVTTWGGILNDLIQLKSTVKEHPNASASAMLAIASQDEVEQKWSVLAERINKFLTVARAMVQKQQTV